MSQLDSLMSQIPLDQLASALGVDRAQVEEATRSALPALVGGMQANASDPAGARSLAGALGDHASTAVPSVEAVDTDDGQKIVRNIFGGSTDNVVSTLGGNAGGSDLMSRLLPMLAPIVMSLIARQLVSGGGLGGILGGGASKPAGGTTAGGGFGGGGMGPGGAGAGASPGLGGLTDMLGSILGGGSGGLDDLLGGVLGGMLGGGKR